MRRLLPSLVAATLAAALALVTAPRADAYWKGPCVGGTKRPTCYFWQGKVTFVADGDTLDVDVQGDGTSTPRRVRVTGINAMEQSVYSTDPAKRRGACHALEATARLEQLVELGGRVVRLGAQDPGSTSGRRSRRSVAVYLSGAWRDAGQILLDEGHALWLPNRIEWARNSRYNRGAQKAAAARLGLWDPDQCASGPDEATPLKMWVNWDADGTDGVGNLNGEWVKIKNVGSTDLPIAGWWLRDSFLARYTFPSGAVIPAGAVVTLYVGSRPSSDTNTTTHFYWRRASSVFDNVGPAGMGDGGYLFDTQGDLRISMMYPCRYGCTDPLHGNVRIAARASSPEEVRVRNTSASPVDLEGYVVENRPYVYSFGSNTVLAPGETVRLSPIGSPTRDTRLRKHWGKAKYILNDSGDKVALRTAANVFILCYAWGSASC